MRVLDSPAATSLYPGLTDEWRLCNNHDVQNDAGTIGALVQNQRTYIYCIMCGNTISSIEQKWAGAHDELLAGLVPLGQYAARHGKSLPVVRRLADSGRLKTARKIGRNWLVDAREPYPKDLRAENCRKIAAQRKNNTTRNALNDNVQNEKDG